jgi:hypothetical protein
LYQPKKSNFSPSRGHHKEKRLSVSAARQHRDKTRRHSSRLDVYHGGRKMINRTPKWGSFALVERISFTGIREGTDIWVVNAYCR